MSCPIHLRAVSLRATSCHKSIYVSCHIYYLRVVLIRTISCFKSIYGLHPICLQAVSIRTTCCFESICELFRELFCFGLRCISRRSTSFSCQSMSCFVLIYCIFQRRSTRDLSCLIPELFRVELSKRAISRHSMSYSKVEQLMVVSRRSPKPFRTTVDSPSNEITPRPLLMDKTHCG